MARLGGGIAGWLLGTVPLIAVNVASFENLLDQQESVLAGAGALLVGIVLGGAVAGWLGARGARGGGTAGAGVAGGLAAVLYVGTLMGLMIGSAQLDIAPPLITADPIRVSLAIICLATVLLLVALVVGAFTGRNAPAGSVVPHVAPPRGAVPSRMMAPPGAQVPRPGYPSYPMGAPTRGPAGASRALANAEYQPAEYQREPYGHRLPADGPPREGRPLPPRSAPPMAPDPRAMPPGRGPARSGRRQDNSWR